MECVLPLRCYQRINDYRLKAADGRQEQGSLRGSRVRLVRI